MSRISGSRALAAAALALFVLSFLGAAEVPFLSGRVNDSAGILSASTISELDQMLKAHEDSTSNQVAVLTIPSLDGETIESYSIRVVDTWKLGQKGKDNGVLLLVVSGDRKVRIEVGRGLEGDLPDITCGLIIRREILPRFRNGDYDGGVRAGVTAILAAIRGSYTAEEPGASVDDIAVKIIASAIFLIVVGIFTVIGVFAKGFQSWFLYVFLIPFWLAFPFAIVGATAGFILFGIYALGFPVFKRWLSKSDAGRRWQTTLATKPGFGPIAAGSWSSGGGSSSGGGFSGGGGGFSGGGASGSW